MEHFGQYYTNKKISSLLIDQLTIDDPRHIIELGVGEGSLLKAAIERWIKASYYVADIDYASILRIQKDLPFINSFHLNTLKEDLSSQLSIKKGLIDIGICNPPYLKLKTDNSYTELFQEVNLPECIKLSVLTTDLIFLAKNLQLLKKQGELGIILPDTLITGRDFSIFRESLLKHHNVKGIIQLPEKIFQKTEALTHILIIEKHGYHKRETPVFLSDKQGTLIDQIQVDTDNLIDRMDYKYQCWRKKLSRKQPLFTLGTINAEIKRGNLTHKELKRTAENYLHTTNIEHGNSKFSILNFNCTTLRLLRSKKGDILVSRVGREAGRVCMIGRGQAPISDCLFRIRVDEKYRMRVFKSLTSIKGQQWFQAHSKGVCAKSISKKNLLSFPIC